MNQRLMCAALVAAAAAAPVAMAQEHAHAQDHAQVLSAVPVLQQVAVPQQMCRTEQQLVQRDNTGAGAFVGTAAGGAAGNAFGSGEGRALTTLLGMLLGALWGDRIEGRPAPQAQQVRQCVLHSVLQQQVVGYDVRYEYAGRQYRVQLPQDPGPTLAVQLTPMGGLPMRAQDAQQKPSSSRVGGEDFSGH